MSTLWTPEGEHRVPEEAGGAAAAPPPPPPPPPGGEGGSGASDAEFAELERELVAAPAETIIANHCIGLFQLAVLHLNERPPDLGKARLAIDALGAIVDTLGDRLGEAAETLRGALAQTRLAFVELSSEEAGPPSEAAGPNSPDGDGTGG
jgi:hypothetical protein